MQIERQSAKEYCQKEQLQKLRERIEILRKVLKNVLPNILHSEVFYRHVRERQIHGHGQQQCDCCREDSVFD